MLKLSTACEASMNADLRTESTALRAMGTTVEVVVVHSTDDRSDLAYLAVARSMIKHLESQWSRFLIDSDISRLNRADGKPLAVDWSTLGLLTSMIDGWVATSGAFDPTLLAPLIALGYAANRHDPTQMSAIGPHPQPRTRITDLIIDDATHTVRAPRGCCIDPGGIGKGLAADLTVAALLNAGAAGALVSVGGDVRVGGQAPQEPGWLVGLTDPHTGREHGQVAVIDGGIATSGTSLRHWIAADGRRVHHLLDPTSARPVNLDNGPANADLVEVTVVAGTGAWAEVWTKAVFVNGPDRGFADLDRLGLAGQATFASGEIRQSTRWGLFDTGRPDDAGMSAGDVL